jgi:hypothetical protein
MLRSEWNPLAAALAWCKGAVLSYRKRGVDVNLRLAPAGTRVQRFVSDLSLARVFVAAELRRVVNLDAVANVTHTGAGRGGERRRENSQRARLTATVLSKNLSRRSPRRPRMH